jgi:putative endonuclease
MTKNNKLIGKIGENYALEYFRAKGWHLLERNFSKKWGEIDIILRKDDITLFVEVKTVVSHENSSFHPEDNVTMLKQRKIRKMVNTYLWETYGTLESKIEFNVACVYIDRSMNILDINIIKEVLL